MSIPNLITLGRIILVPIVVWAIISGEMLLAFSLFLGAGISDAVDGFLAKRFHMASELGAYLDPLADKALIVSIYVSLGIARALPISLVILVVSRDIMIIGGFMLAWLVDKPMKVQAASGSRRRTPWRKSFWPRWCWPSTASALMRRGVGDRWCLPGRRLDLAVDRLLSRRVGPPHEFIRAGHSSPGPEEPCCSSGTSRSGSAPSSSLSVCSGCSVRSCCPLYWGWPSPMCSIPWSIGSPSAVSAASSPRCSFLAASPSHWCCFSSSLRRCWRIQLSAFIDNVPEYALRLQLLVSDPSHPWLKRIVGDNLVGADKSVGDLTKQAMGYVTGFLASLWVKGQALLSVFSLLIIMPVVAFYLICDWERMVRSVDRLIPLHQRPIVRGLFSEIDAAISAYVRGQTGICLILGS